MSLLINEDNTHFILRTYRDQMALTKKTLLKQRIRLLSEQHGNYIYLAPSANDKRSLDIILSSDSGYLLAETVWNYFNKPSHLIFCERHPEDDTQLIIIVVIENTIFLDTLLPIEELASELIPLFASQHAFEIIVCGDIPIVIEDESHVVDTEAAVPYKCQINEGLPLFIFPKSLTLNLQHLKISVINQLPIYKELELQPLFEVLNSKLLGQSIAWPLLLPVVAVGILVGVWWFYPRPPEQPPIKSVASVKTENPYDEFYKGLQTPGPQSLIENLVQRVNNISLLPGWETISLNYSDQQYQISLNRVGGDAAWLNNWAQKNHYSAVLTTSGAELEGESEVLVRSKAKHIYPLEQVMSFIDDGLSHFVDDNGLVVGVLENHGNAQSLQVTLNLDSVSPSLLVLIGHVLGNTLPITINTIQLNQDDSYLLSGSIQFSVWGK